MKKNILSGWKKTLCVFSIFASILLGISFGAHAQVSPPGISISWDKEIGCQVYDVRPDDKDGDLFLEDIGESDCIRFCEKSYVNYTLANVPSGATTVWNVVGGTIVNSSASTCLVNWANIGSGSLSFTITVGSSIINKTLCIEKVAIPTALFDVAPGGLSSPIYVCANQPVNFMNLSTTNNGTSLVSYLWDFGDGTSSTAFEPSHTYASNGTYTVSLTVKNECNCTARYRIQIIVKGEGFKIDCPTVVCEGQSAVYSIPDYVRDGCGGNFNWTVTGGTILSQQNGQVEVLWDNVDQFGFGYVTFDPSPCGIDCSFPVTVKVPVIQTNGTIQGPTDLCLGEQGRYKLPQWPTTEIQWSIIGNFGGALGQIFQTDQRNEVIVTPLQAGTIVLRATYTNTLLNCSGEAEFTINVGEQLTVAGNPIICQNTTETYTNSLGISANWTLTTNTGSAVTTQSGVNFTYNFTQAGNYLLTADQAGYCAGEQKTITVVAKPSAPAGIIGDIQVCPNAPYTYMVQSPNAANNYYWSIPAANGSIIGANIGEQVNITFTGTFPAIVSVYQQTLSPIECASDPVTLTVNQIPINAEISNTQTAVCGNSLASYSAFIPTTTNLYTDGDTYTWSFANASPSGLASSFGSVTNGQGTNSIDVTWNNVTTTTTLDLVLTVTKCNISTQFVRQITLYPNTEISLTATPNPVCGGTQVAFTVQSANGLALNNADDVIWNFGAGNLPPNAGQFSNTHTFTNNSTVAVTQLVTVYVTGSCGQSNTATVAITVLPNPPAIATLTSAANTFCSPSQVFATMVGASSTTGTVTYQWLHNNVPIPGATTSSLNVTPSNMGAGNYTFQVTHANMCVSNSNPVELKVEPCLPCTMNGSATNNSYLASCGTINFVGTTSPTPISQSWQVLGPSPTDYSFNYSGPTIIGLTGKPGNYKIINKAEYPCSQGGTGFISSVVDIVIPHEPEFSYVAECTGNNSFNVDFIDNSIFYALVSPQTINFSYRLGTSGPFTPVTYNPALGTGNFELTGLSAGTYTFKQEVSGALSGVATLPCSKEYIVNLQGINPGLVITVNNGLAIDCHNTAVLFQLLPLPPSGTTTLWDFDDAGAQNTLASPARVFNTANSTYNVTCLVTNQFGCSAVLSTPVFIPDECFFGDIVSNPSPAEVCQGQPVILTYVPNGDNCAATNYVWMNGNNPVVGAPNSSSISVTSTGFYWVKVFSAGNCDYASPTQIKPLFKTLPNLKLIGESTFCIGDDIKFSVTTNVTSIAWFMDGSLSPQFNNMTAADYTGLLAPGNHTVTVVVTSVDGCTNSTTLNFSIVAPPTSITFSTSYNCVPYQAVITANPSPIVAGMTYNWSNGASTQTITVPDGGPYQVTVNVGGCSFAQQVDIPKNPEDYLWIFPTGCHTACNKDWLPNASYLVGPTLPLPAWSWNQNYGVDQSGAASYPTPYTLYSDALYSLDVNTGPCSKESETLDFNTVPCERCEIELVNVENIVQNSTPYCSFTYTIGIYSMSSTPFQATIFDNNGNVVIIPSSITIPANTYQQYTFTVIPQSPFTSGPTVWTVMGSVLIDGQYVDCIYELETKVPDCAGDFPEASKMQGILNDAANNVLKLFPNPASDVVSISYELVNANTEVEIYDLAGRSISKHALSETRGELQVNTSAYQSGVYIVVVKQNNMITWQQKLVIE